jgi:BirA family biotin operon repressor/biotin-[acetyl-CoA-carboxylase] ligase
MKQTNGKVLKISNLLQNTGVSYSVQLNNNGNQEVTELRIFPFSTNMLSNLKKFVSEDSAEFNVHRFRDALTTSTIGSGLIYLREVDSTMNIGKEVEFVAPTGTIILAEVQTQAKGREGRPWVGKKGNLYFTLILKLPPLDLAKLNFCASLCVAQTCKDFGVEDVHVKWPNDVWIGYKKVCGILLNASITGSLAVAQVGIGVNLNEDMSQSKSEEVKEVATSVSQALGSPVDRETFLAKLFNNLERYFALPWDKVLEIYKEFDILVGKDIIVMPKKAENPERVFAKAIGFEDDGCLIIEKLVDGELQREVLINAEVSVRPNVSHFSEKI